MRSISTQLGKLKLLGLIGFGAMGRVYLAERQDNLKRVAVKLVAPRLMRRPKIAARFEAEAQVLMRISHPNVVQVLDYGDLPDGARYLVLEWLDGVGLDVLLEQRPRFSLAEALPFVEQIGAALQAAHDSDVIHRDLKPENIIALHSRPLTVKVLDFGVAKMLDPIEALRDLTRAGEMVGTPLFMAPEQIEGQRDRIGPRTDLYAFGLLLYTMLGGEHPFESEELPAVLLGHLHEAPRPLNQLAPELPDEVVHIVHRCLAKDPDRRPLSAREVIEAFAVAEAEASGEPSSADEETVLYDGPLAIEERAFERELPRATPLTTPMRTVEAPVRPFAAPVAVALDGPTLLDAPVVFGPPVVAHRPVVAYTPVAPVVVDPPGKETIEVSCSLEAASDLPPASHGDPPQLEPVTPPPPRPWRWSVVYWLSILIGVLGIASAVFVTYSLF